LCSDRITEEVTMPNRSAEHSLTLTVDEAAALIGVSRSTVYDLVATDELPTVRLRRRILVPASALADLLGMSLWRSTAPSTGSGAAWGPSTASWWVVPATLGARAASRVG
jgi:excisionase family DNA binding protein